MPFHEPTPQDVGIFQKRLRDAGVPAFIRKPRGRDIYAACGQLKRTLESSILPAPLVTIGSTTTF
jgi:23S rRNA (adenine2503-C2)-methyltransferase